VRGNKRGQPWIPGLDWDTSALAWRAVAPRLSKRSSWSALLGVFTGSGGATGGMGVGGGGATFSGGAADSLAAAQQSALRDAHQELSESQIRRLAPYEFACLELSERLTPDEEERLRATGELPDWFMADLKTRAAEIRKRRDWAS
jgi:hypothetical protein